MKQKPRRVLLRRLLLRTGNNKRLWPALIALFMGTVLLLYSVILWTGFKDVLSGKYDKGTVDGTYLTISKPITTDKDILRQKQAVFTEREIRALNSIPVVEDMGIFTAGKFPVEVAFTGDKAQFSTSLFLEAVPKRFIDNKPLDWQWQYTSTEVPVIVSTEFLNLYNFGYASNQGVPQLTQGTIKALEFDLIVGDSVDKEIFTARVKGFSDRISSILAPEEFIEYGNKRFAPGVTQKPSRLILRVKDPSDQLFTDYLKETGYTVNNELLRWNRLRIVINAATLGIGVLAVILLAMGASVFSLFAQLTMTHARKNLQLLIELGYNPDYLRRFMFVRYVFILLDVMILAGIAAVIAQVRTAKYILSMNLHIATFPAWQVWVALLSIFLILLGFVNRVIAKAAR